jgi:hypothetical protein
MAGHLPGKLGWPVAQVAGELEILDDMRGQRAGARSAPEFMPRLSGGVVGADQRYPMLRRGRFQRG